MLFFQAQHPNRPTAYPHMGVQFFFSSKLLLIHEVLPPNNSFFHTLGAPNLMRLTWCTQLGAPNWGEKNRTHIVWGCASLPPSWLCTAYTVPIVLVFPICSIPSRPNQLKSLSKQSNQVGRINLEPTQGTASKHRSPHSVRVRVRVRVRVEWL